MSSGTDKIKVYLEQRLTESRGELDRSYRNLGNVAKFCEENYLSAPDKDAALDKTMLYTTQALASVAYQVNVVSAEFIQLLELQNRELGRLTAEVGVLDTKVHVHKERIARRHIGQLTSNRPTAPVPGMRHPGIVYHENAGTEKLLKYIRRPIDYDALDSVGHGPAVSAGSGGGGGGVMGSLNDAAASAGTLSMSRQSSSTASTSTTNTAAAAAAAAVAAATSTAASAALTEDFQRASSYSSASGGGGAYAAAGGHHQQKRPAAAASAAGNYGTLPASMHHHHHQQQQQPPMGIAKPIMQQQQQQQQQHNHHRNSLGYNVPPPLGPADASPPPPPLLSNGGSSGGGGGGYYHQHQYQPQQYQQQQQLGSPESLPPPPPPPPDDFGGYQQQQQHSQYLSQQQQYQSQLSQQQQFGTSAAPSGVDISSLLPQVTDQLVPRRPDDPDWVPQFYIQRVVAIYEYAADKDDELTFRENDVIYVVKKNDDGWWEGYMGDGVSGLFPGNYVE